LGRLGPTLDPLGRNFKSFVGYQKLRYEPVVKTIEKRYKRATQKYKNFIIFIKMIIFVKRVTERLLERHELIIKQISYIS